MLLGSGQNPSLASDLYQEVLLKPETIARFERLPETFLLDVESLKEQGVKVAGLYCTFAPTELVRAAGVITVGLCGKKQAPIPAAEKVLPTRLCPLIKSSYGYAVTETCPFFEASDFLIGETTCDGKKKMFELLKRLKPLHVMNLPYAYTERQLSSWRDEMCLLGNFLEQHSGTHIEDAELRKQIRIQNEIRELLAEIANSSANKVVPLSGLDMMSVMESKNFAVQQEYYVDLLRDLACELRSRTESGLSACKDDAPRILLTGCPVGKGSDKVLRLIEESGGIVVCQENCTGLKSFDLLVDEDGDPYDAIARRYLRTPCSCMSPNTGRLDLLTRIIEQFDVHGVVDLTWFCCHTYNVESFSVQEFVNQEFGLPFMQLETDYSETDLPQLRVRIEAFLEMLYGRP